MSRPGWTRIVPLYVAFDLSQLTLWRLLSVGLFPLVLFALVAPFAFAVTGLDESFEHRAVVICAACAPGELEDAVAWPVEVVSEAPDDLVQQLERGEADAVAILDLEGGSVVKVWGDGEHRDPQLERRLRTWVERKWVEERAGPLELVLTRPSGEVVASDEAERPEVPELDAEGMQEAVSQRFQVGDMGSGVGYAVIGLMGLLVGLPLGAGIAEKGREGFLALVGLQTSRTAIYVGEMISDGLQIAVQSAVWWLLYLVLGLASVAAGMLAGELGPEVFVDMGLAMALAALALVQSCAVGCAYGQLVQDVPVQIREHGRTVLLLAIFGGAQALVPLVENIELTPERISWIGALPAVGPLGLWALHLDGAWQLWPLAALHVGWAALSIVVGSFFFHLQDSPLELLRRRFAGPA